ncbi:MAG: hypothetical protein KF799_02495 [Bdellovibrionales bacterium]|nr:hypothetical protein [Bdellovibrionales bacterium]
MSRLDFRAVFSHGLSVAAHRASPAYAAFEDIKENYEDTLALPDRSGEMIVLGERFELKSVESFPRQRHIALKGLTMKAPPPEVYPVRAEQPILLAAQSAVRFPKRPVTPVPESSYHVDPRDDAWSISMASSPRRTITAASGTPILIARGDMPSAANTPNYIDEPSETFVTNLSAVTGDPDAARPMWLNGQIEMTGGLAFVGPETQLLVKRVLNGATQESGRIWVTEGRFEIHVKKATGYLVAELFTRDGRVLGRGELNLLHLRDISTSENRINDLRIALRPTTDTASIRAVSDTMPVNAPASLRQARVEIESYTEPTGVNDDGYFSEPSLDRDSTFVARTSAPGKWSSLVVGQAGQPQDVRVLSNSLVEALVQLNLEGTDRAEAMQMGIVWGQIQRDAKAVSGAQVELAGEYQPIYFNDAFLPDKNMKATGKNGLFAFLRVRPGVQALRVKSSGLLYPAQVFPTENKHVSYLELELRNKVVSQFRVLDVLAADRPVQARIRLVGTDKILPLNGDQYVEYSVAGSGFMVEAEAGPEYEVSRTTLSGSPQRVHVPVVRREWLRGLVMDTGISVHPAHGIVVGFIDDQDFEVEMTGAVPQDQMSIVYFDAQGKPLPGKSGVAGGGFAIFNAPVGLQTVFVHPLQARGNFSQVVVAEPEYVHVLAWPAN